MASFLSPFLTLQRRRVLSLRNRLLWMGAWEKARNGLFLLAGVWMLCGLHYGFVRLLGYLWAIPYIGALLVWKLSSLFLLGTFAMVLLSGLIISMSSLFYSRDLPFLMRLPVSTRWVFLDKSLEAAFFASWMVALILIPYVLALGRLQGWGAGAYGAFAALLAPLLLLAALLGVGATLLLMAAVPSPRTRDAVWVLFSLSGALAYVVLRLAEPERLARPDALELFAQYLRYLQAPSAPYVPSGWMVEGLKAFLGGRLGAFWALWAALCGAAISLYAVLAALAGGLYARAYGGAQEGRRLKRSARIPPTPEWRLFGGGPVGTLLWKERKAFWRDVRHWSQLALIAALVCVYLFSVSRLPLESGELKSLVCFLNIAVAGFVLSSLALRFTFPGVSLEGRSFWVLRSAPLSIRALMAEKFLFSAVPMTLLATLLVGLSNILLGADRFISWLSLGTAWVNAWVLCAMGVGLGAAFPRFQVENIHQIESSAGGFVYMACALFYIGLTVAAEAWPVQMHFSERLGQGGGWDPWGAGLCAGAFLTVQLCAAWLPWRLGFRRLERQEI